MDHGGSGNFDGGDRSPFLCCTSVTKAAGSIMYNKGPGVNKRRQVDA